MTARPGRDRARDASAPAHYLARLATRWAPVADPGEACQQARAAGLVVHRADPLNAETPLGMLPGGAVVPSDWFYIRNHFGIPALDAATCRLEVGGLAGQPLSLTLADLRSMPSQTVEVTLECAGNGRSGMDPPAPGEQWGLGAVGAAAWTGVPLTEVLARAAPRAGVREVVFRGADRGPVEGRPGPVHFERSLPISGLGSAGALLAYAMNGQPLPAAHGYPLRLIVPGWYGVASVKWLTSIELTDRAFRGHFQADRYHIGGEPLTLQAVRSLITELRPGDPAEPGEVMVCGLAWSGAAPITRVEVSLGGQPWQQAALTDPRHPHGWYSWQLLARLEAPGSITVRARATDAAGRAQPSQPAWNPLGYANNAVHHVQIAATGCTPQRQAQRNDLRRAQA
jgi:DMSO/TMAO reductase YedYZ molybdopterin-dependent catalytic subunit